MGHRLGHRWPRESRWPIDPLELRSIGVWQHQLSRENRDGVRDVEIRTLKATDRIYARADERGLFLEVHPSGSRLWRLKFSYLGKQKRIALGRYPEVTLAEARRKRDDARAQLRDGIDPVAERRRATLLAAFNTANKFGDVAKEYIDKMVAEGRSDVTTAKVNGCWSNSSRSSTVQSLI